MYHNNRTTSFSEADRMRALSALGHLSSINPEAVPLSSNYLHNSNYHPSPSTNSQSVAPPLPPRTDASRSMDRYNRFSGYNNCYSPYSRFSPNMYTPAYGGFRTPYNRYGMQDSYNSFLQLAEESTRPAFESIESVVDIVGSISMMLESTYHAVHSSYSAILGVVEQFSRLKDHLAEVLSFLALLRGLKYFCLKILYLLRLRKDNPSVEAAWNSAKSAAAGNDLSRFPEDGKSPWPFFMFLGLVVGAPWLMFKLLAKSVANKKPFDLATWKGQDGRLMACCAAYDFNTNRREEIAFKGGDILYLAPKQLQKAPKGWMLACHKQTRSVGLVPQNYMKTQVVNTPRRVQPLAASEMQRIPENTTEPFPFPRMGSTSKDAVRGKMTDPRNPSTSYGNVKSTAPLDPVNSTDLGNPSSGETSSSESGIPEDPVERNVTDLCNPLPSSEDVSSSESVTDPFSIEPNVDVEKEQN